MIKKNITYSVQNNLCTGCGICEDVCPKKCISIKRIAGEHRPIVDESQCLGTKCGCCLKVCPGVGINLLGIARDCFVDASVKEDKYIGRYVGLHTGYSIDDDIRFHSASGGMVTQFLIYLLENNIIDGAVVTSFANDKITPVSYIAHSREDVIKARSSKYCPVSLNKVGNEIAALTEGKYVIIGTPCHIQGFRKRIAIDRKFRERIVGLFSIYCSSQRTYNAQDYLFQHYGVKKDNISYFAYRDNGCLGYLTINQQEGKNISVPYTTFYGPMLRSFFKPHRCLTCIDHYGELADVCFGDIHIAPYDQDKVGISSWITRSEYWENLFIQAAKEGYIHMSDVSAETLNRSQKTMLFPKKRRANAVMIMDRLIGRKTPIYDKQLDKPCLKDFVSELLCHCQRFVGKHRKFWFIIELLNKGK